MTLTTPKISVIMAAYNAERYITEAIQSVQNQTCSDWELVIVDDASTDRTPTIIADFAQKEPRIRSFRLPQNSGQAAALNKALELAQGEYIAVLDSDDVAMPTRLEKQALFLETHPDVALVGSWAEFVDPQGKHIKVRKKPATDAEIRFRLLLTTQFVHPSVAFRRDVVQKLGGYNKQYLYAEDYDLWSRIAEAGYGVANIQEALVKYRIHPGSITTASKSQQVQEQKANDVNERNIRPYITLTRARVKRLVDFVNGWPQPLWHKIVALGDLRHLALNYISKGAKTMPEKHLVWRYYKAERWHLLVSTIKKLNFLR